MSDDRVVAAFQGALLGTAVGDALGLPFEGMSKRRVRKILGDGGLSHRFVLGRGMVSDDTDHADTTAAIAGALCGAARGVSSLPREWVDGIVEWPRSIAWMRALGAALARDEPPPRYFAPGLLLRNAVFLAAVYAQILRRALPPYG